jgi:hypothetical protein
MGHVAHEHRPAVDLFDGKSIDGRDHVRRVVHAQRVIFVADFYIARRQNDVLTLQRRTHVRGGQAARLQGLRIEVSHDYPGLAAVGIGNLGSVNHGQRRTDDVLTQIVELGVGQGFARQTQLNDGNVGGTVTEHQRRGDIGRHVLEHHQRAAGKLRYRARHVRALVQVHFLDAHALVTDGFDARNVIHQGSELALMQRQDAILDILRTHSVIGPNDGNHGNVDFWKYVDRHAQRSADSHQGNQYQHGDHRVGSLQSGFDYGHARCFEIMDTI